MTWDLALALIAAVIVSGLAWFWRYAKPWSRIKHFLGRFWVMLHRGQLVEIEKLRQGMNAQHESQLAKIEELRQDVDALLSVLDHWVTPGAGDRQRQFGYMAEVLTACGKRGISGAGMRVASLIADHEDTWS